jgi:hypothetical protein
MLPRWVDVVSPERSLPKMWYMNMPYVLTYSYVAKIPDTPHIIDNDEPDGDGTDINIMGSYGSVVEPS